MTRKDFELIAETIRFLQGPRDMREYVAKEFAKALAGTNSGFKKERFIAAATKPLKGEAIK